MNTDDMDAGPSEARQLTRRAALAAGAGGAAALALGGDLATAAPNLRSARYNRPVVIHAPRAVVFDLDKVQAIQDEVLGELGCPGCLSGFTPVFTHDVVFVQDAEARLGIVDTDDIIDDCGASGPATGAGA